MSIKDKKQYHNIAVQHEFSLNLKVDKEKKQTFSSNMRIELG